MATIQCVTEMPILDETHLDVKVLQNEELKTNASRIAVFLDKVFREPPYEYHFTPDQWDRYVGRYVNEVRSVVVLAVENDKIVGIMMGLPLASTSDKYKKGFHGDEKLKGLMGRALTQAEFESAYYLGDLAVTKEKQHQGLASKMYELFEKAVQNQEKWSRIVLWQLKSQENEPSGIFFRKAGFACPGDIWFDEVWDETSHRMMGWEKLMIDEAKKSERTLR